MKLLLPYCVEFSDDRSILPKTYPKNCAVSGPDQKPIIMITHDESTFFANDGRRKVGTLDEYGILRPKKKRKRNYDIRFSSAMVMTQPVLLTFRTTKAPSRFKYSFWSCDLFWIWEDRRRILDRWILVRLDHKKSSTYRASIISRIWVVIYIWQHNKLFNLCKRCIISCAHE